jgi:hypothetical protein
MNTVLVFYPDLITGPAKIWASVKPAFKISSKSLSAIGLESSLLTLVPSVNIYFANITIDTCYGSQAIELPIYSFL